MPQGTTKKVLVTGGNGYIGSAVARAFARGGWTTYGLVRKPEAMSTLAANEVLPVLGSPGELSFIEEHLEELKDLDVVVSTTEQMMDYVPHYEEIVKMLRRLAELTQASGKRLLVLFTSGVKDYGETGLHGAPGLRPHTEQDAINPPPWAANRANYSLKIFDHADLFDAVLLRPTHVHGFSSSFYGRFFELAAKAKADGSPLKFSAEPNGIMHSLHVDDCGDAYRMLAEHPDRRAVAGQSFNVSPEHYETLGHVCDALAREYGIGAEAVFRPEDRDKGDFSERYGSGFSQWVDSSKVRRLTGWGDKRPLFAAGIHRYRVAYEAAKQAGHEDLKKAAEKTKRPVQ